MDILFLIFNAAIVIQYAELLSRWGITRSVEKYVFAYFLLMVQIIGTLLFLGAIGCLYRVPAILINVIIILYLSYFNRPIHSNHPAASNRRIWRTILAPLSNKLIAAASLLTLIWLLVCAYFLPPRLADDMTYHLPFIYESIQRGQWALLPTNLRIHFAYPMNAEVFYAWPVLFLKNTRWVDAAQIPIGAWTSGIIYVFARYFGIRRTYSFLLSGIFFLTPIVIAQMGTDYIDLASAGFLLSSLYLTMRFLITYKKIYVRLAFLSIGTMMGIKYHLLFWGLILALLLLFILIRKKWHKDFLWGIVAIVALGLGWHLRNWWLFSDWLYPAKVTASYWGIGHPSAWEICLSIIDKINIIFVRGVNNATEDGGFARYFSFIAFLSVILMGWIFLLRKNSWKKGEFLFFGIALSFFLIIIPIGKEGFPWIGARILLVAWPIFLLIFGRILFLLNKKYWIHQFVIIICFIGFVQDMMPVITSQRPHHHWWGKIKNSEFESYPYASWYIKGLGPCTSILDVLTASLPKPATVFLATPPEQFFSAPFYGSHLQARIINFDPQFKGHPDFLVYLTMSSEPLIYIGNYRKTLLEAESSGYRQIYSSADAKIFANPRLFKSGN